MSPLTAAIAWRCVVSWAPTSKKRMGGPVATNAITLSRRQRAMVLTNRDVNFPALSAGTGPAAREFRTIGPTATSSQSYAQAVRSGMNGLRGDATRYARMLLDPHQRENQVRYPDETIVPTALVHFTSTRTQVVTEHAPYSAESYWTEGSVPPASLVTLLRWKVANIDVTGSDVKPIFPPRNVADWVVNPTGPPVRDDYGGPQSSWHAINSVDRSLALGIRCRVVGLPTSTFMPAGTLYFLQLQATESGILASGADESSHDPVVAVATVEERCRELVQAGKGFSLTLDEVHKAGGINIPYLPQGPMSFLFSDNNARAPTGDFANASSGDTTRPEVAAANGQVAVFAFGIQPGCALKFDYSHHVEYVPTFRAAGIIRTQIQPPSGAVREAIAHTTQKIQSGTMGSTSLSQLQLGQYFGDRTSATARDMAGSFGSQLGSAIAGSLGGAIGSFMGSNPGPSLGAPRIAGTLTNGGGRRNVLLLTNG